MTLLQIHYTHRSGTRKLFLLGDRSASCRLRLWHDTLSGSRWLDEVELAKEMLLLASAVH